MASRRSRSARRSKACSSPSRSFRPVLRRAQELDLFLFAHPYYVGSKSGLECYYLTNLIGNPLDTTMMVANLMFSGALDELPVSDLPRARRRLHALPDRPAGARAQGAGGDTRVHRTSPRDLLRRFHFDSLVFEPQALRYLIDLVGADRVCIGTDAPFDMADEDPRRTLAAVPRLTPAEEHAVCCGTALRLLGESP